MEKYKYDVINQKMTISKAFADKASRIGTEEYDLVKEVRAANPQIQIYPMSRRTSSRPNRYKGMTYKRMEKYIKIFDNANEILEIFERVKYIGSTQRNCYKFVFDWFMKQFPDYGKMPEIMNGKIYIIPIYPEIKSEIEKEQLPA